MASGKKKAALRPKSLTFVGVSLVIALVLLVATLVYHDRRKAGWVHEAKNWFVLAVSILGMYATFRARSLKEHPQRGVIVILLLALLAYVSLQDIMDPGFVLPPLTMAAPLLQTVVVLLLIAPFMVRKLGVKLPDIVPSVISTPPRRK